MTADSRDFPNHPAADLFPMMDDTSLQQLAEHIRVHGLKQRIEILDEQVLDGRNRLAACKLAGVKPQYWRVTALQVGDPIEYVLSRNLHRRHLTAGQRALVAERVASMRHGGDRSKSSADDLLSPQESAPDEPSPATRTEAAARLNVSTASLDRIRQLKKKGIPELVAWVDIGGSIRTALDVARLPEDEQRAAIAGGGWAIDAAAKRAREILALKRSAIPELYKMWLAGDVPLPVALDVARLPVVNQHAAVGGGAGAVREVAANTRAAEASAKQHPTPPAPADATVPEPPSPVAPDPPPPAAPTRPRQNATGIDFDLMIADLEQLGADLIDGAKNVEAGAVDDVRAAIEQLIRNATKALEALQ